jgi:hypothetical protein
MGKKAKKKTAKKKSTRDRLAERLEADRPPETEEPELNDPFAEGDDPTPPVAHEPVVSESKAETEPEPEPEPEEPKPAPKKVVDADEEAAERAAEASKAEGADDAWSWRDKAIAVLGEKGFVREDVQEVQRYPDRGVTVYRIKGTGKPIIVSD